MHIYNIYSNYYICYSYYKGNYHLTIIFRYIMTIRETSYITGVYLRIRVGAGLGGHVHGRGRAVREQVRLDAHLQLHAFVE